jgi:hypothetical protein
MLFETQVKLLFIELEINFIDFYKTSAKFKQCDLGRYYSFSDVANYIDTQISLRESKN